MRFATDILPHVVERIQVGVYRSTINRSMMVLDIIENWINAEFCFFTFLFSTTKSFFPLFIFIIIFSPTARLFRLCPVSSSLSSRSWSFIDCPGSLFDTLADWSVRSPAWSIKFNRKLFFFPPACRRRQIVLPTRVGPVQGWECLIRYLEPRPIREFTIERKRHFYECSRLLIVACLYIISLYIMLIYN